MGFGCVGFNCAILGDGSYVSCGRDDRVAGMELGNARTTMCTLTCRLVCVTLILPPDSPPTWASIFSFGFFSYGWRKQANPH